VNDEKKIVFLTFRAFSRAAKKLDKRKIVKAESFSERDEIARLLAGESYEIALHWRKQKKYKLELQWMKLAARLLNLSLRPKRLADLDEIKKALADLKAEEPEQG
jgi:NTP pyrophosphatase (non-canonical NTP hydrolase)